MNEFISINRINKSSIPGKGFMPGPSKNGGFVKVPYYKDSVWYGTEEPTPSPPEPRPYTMLEAPGINNGTLWLQNVPLGYPFRKIEYDEGTTFIRRKDAREPVNKESDSTFMLAFIGLAIVTFIVYKL